MVNGGLVEDVAVIGVLIGVQFVYAGNALLLSYLMSLGLESLTIVTFTSFATFLILLPFAFYYERFIFFSFSLYIYLLLACSFMINTFCRCRWPTKVGFKLFTQLFLLALGGVTMFQSLFLKGINLTSPAMGTAMPNLAPGLIFIMAWIFRLEKVKLSCTYSRVKIVGTLLCVLGALTLSIMQSISAPPKSNKVGTIQSPSPPTHVTFDRHKLIGCLYLLVAILILSSNIVLQAFTLGDFPAPMSLCSITCFFGTFMTVAVQLIEDHEFKTGWPIVSVGDMIAYSLLAGVVSGMCL